MRLSKQWIHNAKYFVKRQTELPFLPDISGLGLHTLFLVQLATYFNWVLIISYKCQVAMNVI